MYVIIAVGIAAIAAAAWLAEGRLTNALHRRADRKAAAAALARLGRVIHHARTEDEECAGVDAWLDYPTGGPR